MVRPKFRPIHILGVDAGSNCCARFVSIALFMCLLMFIVSFLTCNSIIHCGQHTSAPSVVKGRCCKGKQVGSLARWPRKQPGRSVSQQRGRGEYKRTGWRMDRQQASSNQRREATSKQDSRPGAGMQKRQAGRRTSRYAIAGRWMNTQTGERTDEETDRESERQPETDPILKSTYAQPLVSHLLMPQKATVSSHVHWIAKRMVFGKAQELCLETPARIETVGHSICRTDRKLLPDQPHGSLHRSPRHGESQIDTMELRQTKLRVSKKKKHKHDSHCHVQGRRTFRHGCHTLSSACGFEGGSFEP